MRTINVRGTGRVALAPDQVTISMGVETHGASAAEALSANNKAAAAVIALLKDRGVALDKLQTSNLSVYPRYDDQGQKVVGYNVSNMVTATLNDIGSAGSVIDAAAQVAGDSIRIQGLSFRASDTTVAMALARERAVVDAKTQAQQFAAAADLTLGKVQMMSTSEGARVAPIMARAAFASVGSVPLEGGSTEIDADIDMVFELLD
jgi:uncharacterized protein